MGKIEWAMWANDNAIASSFVIILGGIIAVCGQFRFWEIGAYAIIGVLMFLLEYPRGKRQKGTSYERRFQYPLTVAVSKGRLLTRNYFVRFVAYLVHNLFITKSEPSGTRAMGENNIDIEIIQISDPWNFQACEMLESAKSLKSQEFLKMHNEMNQHCKQLTGTEFYRPNVGDVCAALSREDNLWHRVRIERIMSQSHGQHAMCYMVDKGSQLSVSTLRLMSLPKKFQEFPHQVHQCCLWGIQPLTLKIIETDIGLDAKSRPCHKWDPAAVEYMRKMVEGSRGCQAEIINIDSENTLFFRLYLTTEKGLVCFNEALIDENYALKVDVSDFGAWHKRLTESHGFTPEDTLTSQTSSNTKYNSQPRPNDMPALVPNDMPALVPNDSPALVPNDMPALVPNDMPALLPNDMPAVVPNDMPALVPNDMPALVPNDLQKSSPPKVKNNKDDFSFCGSGLFSTDTQEQPLGCDQLNNDVPTASAQNKQGFSMHVMSRKDQKLVPNIQSRFCSKSSVCDQQSVMPNRRIDADTQQMPLDYQKSSQISLSKLVNSTRDTPSVAAPAACTNVFFGRGRGMILAKGNLSQKSPVDSLQNECSRSTYFPSQGDSIETSPLVVQGSHSKTESFPYINPNDSNLWTGSAESTRLKCSKLQTPLQPSSCSTLPTIASLLPTPAPYNLKVNSSHGGGASLEESASNNSRRNVEPHFTIKEMKDRLAQINLNKEKYLSQFFQGRTFSETFNQSNDHLGSRHCTPVITRQDKPVPRPIFGVVVHGKGIPSLICDVQDVPFKDCVKKVLRNENINTAKSIQAWVWPAVLGCRHVIGICPPNLGKTMSFVPAVASLILDQSSYILPPGKGPLALVVVPSWKKGRNVLEMVDAFTLSEFSTQKQIKAHVLYSGGVEENEHNQMSLLQGCDILIATPHSLLRSLDQDITSLRRLCHIILDDAEILAARFAKEVEAIMQLYRLQLKDRRDQKKWMDVPRQTMIFASHWSAGVEEFRLRYTVEPIIAISSRVEASVYGGVKQVVTIAKWEQRLTKFCALLDALSCTGHRVAAFAQDVVETNEMYEAARSRGVYCLLIHENLQSETISEVRDQWLCSSHSRQLMVIVCTDQCYQDLAITNATMVVHYGLPDSKTKFGNRLACMLDYFQDRTSSVKPEIEPVSQVILTNRCASRAQSLYKILQRCPAYYSPQLENLLQCYKRGLDNDERNTLCPFLKSFGFCSDQDKCKHRHMVIPKQDLKTGEISHSTLPSSGEVKIKIQRTENASHFYCHLINHRSVPDNTRTDLRLEYQRLVMEMVSFFSKENNHVAFKPSDDPFLDDICAFKDSNNIYYRAKVVQVHAASIATPKKFKVWLVDAGYHQTGTSDQLLRLPQRLAEVPYQAVEVYLCCVKPMDNDSEWTYEADHFVNDLIQGKELVGRIMLSVGMTLWLLPLVHQVTLKSIGVTNDLNIRQELLDNKFGTVNSDHIHKLYDLFRGHTQIPEKLMRQYFDYALEMEMRQETLDKGDNFHQVMIAAVINPGLLYVQKWDNFEFLEKLESRIAEVTKQTTERDDLEKGKTDTDMKLERGSVCLALSSDGRWYRAKIVTDLAAGQWGVFFLDYGDREQVSTEKMQPLPRELAELPCQAIECELAHIQPPAGTWQHKAVNVICDLAYFVNGDKRQLFAKVVRKQDPHFVIGQKLVIDMYDGNVRFSQELVWRHLAECTEEDDSIKMLLGKPALKNQLFFNTGDKIPYLCANMYWCENHLDAIQQAKEIHDILSCRDDGWDSNLVQREVMAPAFKVVGYIQDIDAHDILLDCLVSCCVDSDRLMEIAISENFTFRLASCLEQVSRPIIQHQAAQAITQLVNNKSLCESLPGSTCLASVLTQFLSQQHHNSDMEFETLKCLCSAAAKLVKTADESICAELISAEMVEQILTSLKETSADTVRDPWLELLAAIATWDSSHKCLMREAHVAAVLDLLVHCSCQKCLYYLLSVCLLLVQNSRRHKMVLLENKLLIILNNLEAGALRSPGLEVCKHLQQEMTLTLPQPERLSGVPAHHVTEVDKITSPSVTWSQNCFRLVLTVKVRDAKVEDFFISSSRISCRNRYDGVQYEFDWELYDSVSPTQSKVLVYASHSLLLLRKQSKGIWSRLLKQKAKLPNVNLDFEHPYDSEDEDIEDEKNVTNLTQKKDLLNQQEMWKVEIVRPYQSSDESSDELALYSHSSDDEPTFDMESLMTSRIS